VFADGGGVVDEEVGLGVDEAGAAVEVGGADEDIGVVDEEGLGMEEGGLELVDLHAVGEEAAPGVSGGVADDGGVDVFAASPTAPLQ